MKPLFKYPGGKGRELKNIRKYYPTSKDVIFVEPFVGAGAVFWDFPDAKEYHINDISVDLINIYRFTKEQDKTFLLTVKKIADDWERIDSENLNFKFKKDTFEWFLERKKTKMIEEEAVLTSQKTAYYVNIRDKYNSELEIEKRAAFYLFIMTFAFSSLFQYNMKGDINIPYGGKGYNSKSFNKVYEKLVDEKVILKLHKTKIYNEDFKDFIKRFQAKDDVFVFLDPPYVSDMIYNGTKFVFDEQINLANQTRKLKNFLNVIGYNPKIYELYNDGKNDIKKIPIKFSINFKGRNKVDKYNLYIHKTSTH